MVAKLLVIDPQIDFCTGTLAVPGATEDMIRLAAFVDRYGASLDDISVTLDSHRNVDIAHAAWWIDAKGNNPTPFTLITSTDVASGRWTPRNTAWRKRSLDYVRQLEANGRYVLIVWPTHCLIGSPGSAVQPDIFAALCRWETSPLAMVNFVTKGANPWTEHYSAVQAEVPDPQDYTTMLNVDLIDSLRECDTLFLAGEALSHCVKATVTDIADNIGDEHIKKFVLLTDCSSSVPKAPGTPDFPAIGQQFIHAMKARGMRTALSTDSFF